MQRNSYAHPETLVTTGWVQEHLTDPNVVVVEVDVDPHAYQDGHLPGARCWDWRTDLCDSIRRDILSKEGIEELLRRSGIRNDSTVILYGDNNNWFAAWAFWQMKIYGHSDVRLMDGGPNKWLSEGRDLAFDTPSPQRTDYVANPADHSIRSFLADVLAHVAKRDVALVDVRSPAEFAGEIIAPPGLPETAQRAGRIPGSVNLPWGEVCNPDGTFKSYQDLEALFRARGVDGTRPIIAYCRIGERSSHMWFVLKYLVGFDGVTNYDGSWTEWGNLVNAPIERSR